MSIKTGYGLDVPGIEFLWRTRFSATVQTCPVAHPAFYTMGTGWNLICAIMAVIIGANGIVTKSLRKKLEAIPGKHSIDFLYLWFPHHCVISIIGVIY
jgi:hypothetical protein